MLTVSVTGSACAEDGLLNAARNHRFAPVAQTGQTTCIDSLGYLVDCADTGQDGSFALLVGIPAPEPRFTDNGDGTVTDNLTHLVWTKDAGLFGTLTWFEALTACNALADNGVSLTDGSETGDWRLPNIRELLSLPDYGAFAPALPAGHPFTIPPAISEIPHWSSTVDLEDAPPYSDIWIMNLHDGQMGNDDKTWLNYAWCVRGGL